MKKPEMPANEKERIEALRMLEILDTDPEERYDRLTRLAQRLLDVPIAMISLVDKDRQWFKSKQGIDANQTSREISFCGHAINEEGMFVVSDATKDERFVGNPLVNEDPKIRFYAAYPLASERGLRVGTFCVIDRKPRIFKEAELQFLEDMGRLAEEELSKRGNAEYTIYGDSGSKYFKSVLRSLTKFAKSMDFPVSVLKFKVSNLNLLQTGGQIDYERFLIDVAKVIGSKTRRSDFVGKLEDDLYYVVAPKCGKKNLELISNRLENSFTQFLENKSLIGLKLRFNYLEYDYNQGPIEDLVIMRQNI